MSLENLNQSEKKDFLVSSASLKDVRAFSWDVFEKFKIDEDLREGEWGQFKIELRQFGGYFDNLIVWANPDSKNKTDIVITNF